MKSVLTTRFRAYYRRLPAQVQKQARKAYQLWHDNPAHPGADFKKLFASTSYYSVRIGNDWRAIGELDGDTVTWIWIGPHAEFDQILRSRGK